MIHDDQICELPGPDGALLLFIPRQLPRTAEGPRRSAALAGEQGRGFAVVASEVRNLAGPPRDHPRVAYLALFNA